ncbi:MAG: hypothetical protein H7A51_13545 [Akkermansiaceae bacterium]|nr:hypothetical protein [Akkermansiaceae bacterium]
MKQRLFIILLLSISHLVAQDKDSIIKHQFNAALEAQLNHKFVELADIQHPITLRFFRQRMGIEYEKLRKTYSAATLSKVIGINGNPKTSPLSDKDVFVNICNKAAELEPSFAGDKKYLPIFVHGIIHSERGDAFIIYEYAVREEAEESTIRFRQPGVSVFIKHNDEWLMKSSALSKTLPIVWKRELYRMNKKN